MVDDDDGDYVMNSVDLCPLTPAGETVDTDGCSQSQLDDDGDGVMNNLDYCPLTPAGETVDANGCSQSQTVENEAIVIDINPGSDGSNPSQFTKVGNLVYFVANDSVHGFELWKSDGTVSGTIMVKDVKAGSESSNTFLMGELGNHFYFVADDGVHGWELWKTDGTETGTVMVKDINPGSGYGIYPASVGDGGFAITSTHIFFEGKDGNGVEGLWKSDGTDAGTVMVVDIEPYSISAFGNSVLFSGRGSDANGDPVGIELMLSDGTVSGTVLIKDIFPGVDSNDNPYNGIPGSEFVELNGIYYFIAEYPDDVFETWRTDGTEVGTYSVGCTFSEAELVNVDNALYFAQSFTELWMSDGSCSGTVMVADIGGGGPSITGFFGNSDGLFFSSGVDGTLWTSDGTAAGTIELSCPTCGDRSVIDSYYQLGRIAGIKVGDLLFFGSTDNPVLDSGYELYVVDLSA